MDEAQGLEPNTILLGKYKVEALLGTGGMGKVIRASHLYLQQSVAIKILLKAMAESPSTVARFLREAQNAVRLKSEHTARVIDVGTLPDGTPFMIMEFLEGNDLGQILKHYGPQPAPVVVDLMMQACEGLAEAHALGIVHRDIKPSNFFITHRPDASLLLKVLDFGISKAPVGYDDLTGTQTVIGTPNYMAPEQMRSGKLADARSDVWSMGIVMYQLIAGYTPFSGETYAELVLKVGTEPPIPLNVPGVSPGLADVIMRCLEKDPAKRIQDVGELARLLAPFATEPGVALLEAQRATRTLATRAGQDLSGASGLRRDSFAGIATPLTPGPHTPHSNPSVGSLAQGKGQVMQQGGAKSRGWMIGGLLALVIAGGAAGLLAARSGNDVPDPPANEPTPAAQPAVTTPAAPVAQPAIPVDAAAAVVEPVAQPAVPVDAAPAVTVPVDAAPEVVASPPATVEEKPTTSTVKPATPKPATPKPATTKPTGKKPTGKKPTGNLFDRRD